MKQTLRIATTTSTRDSGLMDVLIPVFEQKHKVKIKLVAVGTGKALKLGELGEVDVLLVHSKPAEIEFLRNGHASRRESVMFNYFEILGPKSDPANVRNLKPIDAIQKIGQSNAAFVSRGDESGTHQKEKSILNKSESKTDWPKFVETGQGMGASLVIANQKRAYILCDGATYLAMKNKIDLVPLSARSKSMKNPYGVLCINPKKNSQINFELANEFADFLTSPSTQILISNYRIDDQQLFFPLSSDE